MKYVSYTKVTADERPTKSWERISSGKSLANFSFVNGSAKALLGRKWMWGGERNALQKLSCSN